MRAPGPSFPAGTPSKRWQTAAMKKALRITALSLLALVLAALALLATALQREPGVVLDTEVDPSDVATAVALAHAHDPRRAQPGQVYAATLGERDLELLLNHATRHRQPAAMRVSIERGAATLRASLHLPANPFGRWLNIQARVVETGALPALEGWQVGRLPLPSWLGMALARRLVQRAGLQQEFVLAGDLLRQVRFQPQQLSLVYAWRDDSAQRLSVALLQAGEAARLRAYHDCIVALAAAQAPGARPSLAGWLPPLFALARQRSQPGTDANPGAGAAAENRAALLVLTLYANGRGVDDVLPAARAWPRPRALQLTLGGRDDFPLHLLISAALAVDGSSSLSRAVGIYKEIADSRGGSGFSFNDIAADRAGTRLGELAVQAPERLQQRLAQGVQEADFMPAWADLPEFMPEPEFKRRYGGVEGAPYAAMIAEIDRRIAALPALR